MLLLLTTLPVPASAAAPPPEGTSALPYGGRISRGNALTLARSLAWLEALRSASRQLESQTIVQFGVRSASRRLALAAAVTNPVMQDSPDSPAPEGTVSVVARLPLSPQLNARLRAALRHPAVLPLYADALDAVRALAKEGQNLLQRAAMLRRTQGPDSDHIFEQRIAYLADRLEAWRIYVDALGQWRGSWKNPAQAVADLRRALRLDKDNARIWCALGDAQLQQDLPLEALRSLDTAVTLMPDLARALYIRGLAHLRLRQTALAEADLTAALRLDPNNPQWLRARGAVRMVREDYAPMCEDFQRACAQGDCDGLEAARKRGQCLPQREPGEQPTVAHAPARRQDPTSPNLPWDDAAPMLRRSVQTPEQSVDISWGGALIPALALTARSHTFATPREHTETSSPFPPDLWASGIAPALRQTAVPFYTPPPLEELGRHAWTLGMALTERPFVWSVNTPRALAAVLKRALTATSLPFPPEPLMLATLARNCRATLPAMAATAWPQRPGPALRTPARDAIQTPEALNRTGKTTPDAASIPTRGNIPASERPMPVETTAPSEPTPAPLAEAPAPAPTPLDATVLMAEHLAHSSAVARLPFEDLRFRPGNHVRLAVRWTSVPFELTIPAEILFNEAIPPGLTTATLPFEDNAFHPDEHFPLACRTVKLLFPQEALDMILYLQSPTLVRPLSALRPALGYLHWPEIPGPELRRLSDDALEFRP